MPRFITPLIVVLALGAQACSSVTVRTDHDDSADFSRYQTFAVSDRQPAPEDQRQAVSQLVDERIRRSLATSLATKNLKQQSVRSADLVVVYRVGIRTKVRVTRTGYAYPRRWHRGWGWGTAQVHHYREGTLVVDLVDRRNKSLVWRGIAEGAFKKPNPTYEEVDKVVTRVLRDFPPG